MAAFAAAVDGVPGLRLPALAEPGDTSTWKDLTLIVDAGRVRPGRPDGCAAALKAEGIDSRRYFHPPVHRQKAYAHLGRRESLPLTDRLADSVLTVPLWSHMDAAAVRRSADAVLRVQAHAAALRAAGV